MDAPQVAYVGAGLDRPECVLCTRWGEIFTSDRLAGAAVIGRDGSVRRVGDPAGIAEHRIVPNGFALLPGGALLVTSMGEAGGVFRIASDGRIEEFLREVDGVRLTSTNFVHRDERDRLWITVSTRHDPRSGAFAKHVRDGYIVLLDWTGARIVADGLGFPTEVRIDSDGGRLYVNETYAQRVSRFRIAADGSLRERETFAQLASGCFPAGMAFDAAGHLWVATLVRSGIVRLAPDGTPHTMFERRDAAAVAAVTATYDAGGTLHPADVVPPGIDDPLASVTSIAFGGPDLRTVVLGSLGGTRLATFRSPVAGRR